jgi:hypothetical protein
MMVNDSLGVGDSFLLGEALCSAGEYRTLKKNLKKMEFGLKNSGKVPIKGFALELYLFEEDVE